METYGDLLAEIAKIISISEKKKSELTEEELDDYNKYFVKRLYNKDIDIDYATRFDELLDIERTFILYKKSKNPSKDNSALIKNCQAHLGEQDQFTNYYLRLIEILNSSNTRSICDLTEVHGYFVLRDSLGEFVDLCIKLRIGAYKTIGKLTREELKRYFEETAEVKNEQIKRINRHLESLKRPSQNQINNEKVTSDEEDKKVSEKEKTNEIINQILNDDYNEIIFLGLVGRLSIDDIVELKKVLPDENFEDLLIQLELWRVFTKKEIELIKQKTQSCIIEVDNMDILVRFFITLEGFNPEYLKALLPSIGEYNYNYIIDQLFRAGCIDYDYYYRYLQEYIDKSERKQ